MTTPPTHPAPPTSSVRNLESFSQLQHRSYSNLEFALYSAEVNCPESQSVICTAEHREACPFMRRVYKDATVCFCRVNAIRALIGNGIEQQDFPTTERITL